MRQSPSAMLAASLVALLSGNLAAYPVLPQPRVVVRVFDTSGQPAPQLLAALDEAAALMSRAALQVDWRICQAAMTVDPCTSLMGRGERVVRIVSSPPGSVASGRLPLGNAILDARASTGVLATVYFDRAVKMASQNNCDQNTLLGRTIAHELGHLLLGTNAHAGFGLMRAVWTMEELRLNRWSDWKFSDREAAAMRHNASQAVQTVTGR